MDWKKIVITTAAAFTLTTSPVEAQLFDQQTSKQWIEENFSEEDIIYFTLDEQQAPEDYYHGLSKLLNSLSWSDQIINPGITDDGKFWINSQWYGWDYQFETNHIKVDWFISNASKPPLYHDLLYDQNDRNESGELVDTEEKLLELIQPKRYGFYRNHGAFVGTNEPVIEGIHWSAFRGVINQLNQAAGLKKSNVADFNRVINHFDTIYGSYWKSYDFESSLGDQNIIEKPLDFKFDGHEIIFNLPNGLQGYFLTGSNGKRIDEAPTQIVTSDKFGVETSNGNNVIVNGISCMGCHHSGVNSFVDDTRPKYQEQIRTEPYDKYSDIARIEKYYIRNNEWQDIWYRDNGYFQDALWQIDPNYAWTIDPIFEIASKYEEDAPAAGFNPPTYMKPAIWAEIKDQSRR